MSTMAGSTTPHGHKAPGSLNMSLLFSHLFLLITVVLAIIGWFTAFIGQCVAESKYVYSTNSSFYAVAVPGTIIGYGWFAIFLELFFIIYVIWCTITSAVYHSRVALATFSSIAIVFGVLLVDKFIYTSRSSTKAIAAGYFILTVVNILWAIFFTAHESSLAWDVLNNRAGGAAAIKAHNGNPTAYQYGQGISSAAPYAGTTAPSYGGNANNLSNGNKVTAGTGAYGNPATDMTQSANHSAGIAAGNATSNVALASAVSAATLSTSPPAPVYLKKAKALYAYTASADDPNELGFTKGETLEISDMTGKWWHARREDGLTGNVPSNYLQLLE